MKCKKLTVRMLCGIAISVAVVVGLAGPAPASVSMTQAGVGVTRSDLPCDPNAPQGTAADQGITDSLNPQLDGELGGGHLTAYRVSCARMIVNTVRDDGLDLRAATIAVTTAIVESTLKNIDYGDCPNGVCSSSLGLFQQIKAWGSEEQRLDPVQTTRFFLHGGAGGQRGMLAFDWENMPINDVCQAVQQSDTPDAYGPQAHDAELIATALWGNFRVLAGLDSAHFIGARDDGYLVEYNMADLNNPWVIGPGWNDFRALAGLGATHFIGARGDGYLVEYNLADLNNPWVIGPGWGDFRMLTGLDSAHFIGARGDGYLVEYNLADLNNPSVIGPGWSEFRMLAGLDSTHFVGARNDGYLVEYNMADLNNPWVIGPGW